MTSSALEVLAPRDDRKFPVLTGVQVARIAPHARTRAVRRGEILLDLGDCDTGFYVVLSGRLDILRQEDGVWRLVVSHGPGEFSGEVNTLAGRRALVRMQAGEDGELLQLGHDELMQLVQTDSEISQVLMRAFLLRRADLIASGTGDVLLIGSNHSAGTLRAREFLARNGHPYRYVDVERDPDVQALLERFHVGVDDVPVLISGDVVLRRPENEHIADVLGFNEPVDPAHVRDLVILGAGPAGLAAAVYAASEGLDVLVVEPNAPGGQAGSSSRIENYLGFPTGVSGADLAGRALTQAQKFGARMLIARRAARLSCAHRPYHVELDDGTRIPARTIVIATGAEYRRPSLAGLEQFEGAGVYYGATHVEAQLCGGDEIIVVGGGNSAGQAAVYLAQFARKVWVLVRGEGLADTMSRYLIRRLEMNSAIELRTRTEIVGLAGDGRLERVTWRDHRSGAEETRAIGHVFAMTGAEPCTSWLRGSVTLDAKGFVKTGGDLQSEELQESRWPLARPPHLLETSVPGVFAIGDVRSGNVKRVAPAVGEGSIAVSFVHKVLHE